MYRTVVYANKWEPKIAEALLAYIYMYIIFFNTDEKSTHYSITLGVNRSLACKHRASSLEPFIQRKIIRVLHKTHL